MGWRQWWSLHFLPTLCVYLRIVFGNVKAMVGCMRKHNHDVGDEIVNGHMPRSDAQTIINWEGENGVKN